MTEVEDIADVEVCTGVIFWSTVKESARAIDYLEKFCEAHGIFVKRSVDRLWICKEKEAKET